MAVNEFSDDVKIIADSKSLILGASDDCEILWDGSQMQIDPGDVQLKLMNTTGGILIGTTSDEDITLVEVNVTGDPKLYWDESDNAFKFTKNVYAEFGGLIGGTDNTYYGYQFLFGGNANQGGYYRLYNGANTDGTVDYWEIEAGSNTTGDDSLHITAAGATNCLSIDGTNKDVQIHNYLTLMERSSDPAEPADGECVIWMSDGSGKGDDGDVMIATNTTGGAVYGTLFDASGGSTW